MQRKASKRRSGELLTRHIPDVAFGSLYKTLQKIVISRLLARNYCGLVVVVGSELLAMWSVQFFDLAGGWGGEKWFIKQGLQEHFACSPKEKQEDKGFTKFLQSGPPVIY